MAKTKEKRTSYEAGDIVWIDRNVYGIVLEGWQCPGDYDAHAMEQSGCLLRIYSYVPWERACRTLPWHYTRITKRVVC
jgi:hypothetical protein